MTNSVNRAGTSQLDWNSGFRMGFGNEVSAPVFGGGMLFGPTPDQMLGGLTDLSGGRTAGSRNLSTLRFGGDLYSGYAGRAAHGMSLSAESFLSGGPLRFGSAAPQFPGFGMGGMGTQPAAAPYAAPSAAPAPASGINASTPAKDVDDVEGKDDADAIEKLKDEYRASDHGFTDDELDEIFSEIDKVADGKLSTFKRLLKTLPKKDFKEPELDEEGNSRGPSIEQQKSDWVKKYGEWHARNIAKVDGTKVAQLVRDTASGEGVTMHLERAPKAGSGFYCFKVTSVDGNSDVSPGDELFYDPKSENFYRNYDTQKKEFSGLVGPKSETPVDGTRSKDEVTLTVGGGSDYLELTPAGNASKKDDVSIAEAYIVGDTHGKGSQSTVEDVAPMNDGNYRILHRDGKWQYYSKSKNEMVTIPNAQYADGRLYLNKGGSYDPVLAEDAVAYTAKLRDAEEKLPARIDGAKSEKVDQDNDRAEKVWTQLEDMMGEEKSKVTHEYNPETKVLTITCDPKDAKAVQTALAGSAEAGSDDAKAREKKGNAILAELPRGAKVRVNEEGKPFSASANGFNRLKVELGRWEPKPVTTDSNLDMGYLRNSKDAKAAVQKKIEREIENSLKNCYKPTSITLSGEMILPEGKIDQKTWDAIKADVQKQYKEKYGCDVTFTGQVKNVAPETPTTPTDDTKKAGDSEISASDSTKAAAGTTPASDTDATSKEAQAKTYFEKGKDFEAQPDYAAAYYQYNAANSIAPKQEYKEAMARCLHELGKNDITADNIMERKDEVNAFLQNGSAAKSDSASAERTPPAPPSTATPAPASKGETAPAKPEQPAVPEKTSARTAPAAPAVKTAVPTTSTSSQPGTIDLQDKTNEEVRAELRKRVEAANGSAGNQPTVTMTGTIVLPKDMSQGQWNALAKDLAASCPGKALIFKDVHITYNDEHHETTVIAGEVIDEQRETSGAAPSTAQLDVEKAKVIKNVEAKMLEAEHAARQVMAEQGTLRDAAAKCSEYDKALEELTKLVAKYSDQNRNEEAKALRMLLQQHRRFNARLRDVRGNTSLQQWQQVEAAHPKRNAS